MQPRRALITLHAGRNHSGRSQAAQTLKVDHRDGRAGDRAP